MSEVTGSYYVRVSKEIWERLGAEALSRGMSRSKVAIEILGPILDDRKLTDRLFPGGRT
jgi:hypothetical protein